MTRHPLACLALLACAATARADGLSDLKAALARLPANAPVKASLDVNVFERHGDGADATEKNGQVMLGLEDGTHGLQVTYGKELLARADAEARQVAKDPEAKTPTRAALSRLDAGEITPMVSAAPGLARALEEAQFTGEKAEAWQGRPARRLSFSVPMSHLSKEQRKYVKDFDSTLDIWIAADGTPLASARHDTVAGRAFVVISFEAKDEESCTYAVSGDRLLTLRRESHNVSSGAGEHSEERVVKTLQPVG